MNNTYDKTLRHKVLEIADNFKIPVKQGVLSMIFGPHFETPSECNLLKMLGADVVGNFTSSNNNVVQYYQSINM